MREEHSSVSRPSSSATSAGAPVVDPRDWLRNRPSAQPETTAASQQTNQEECVPGAAGIATPDVSRRRAGMAAFTMIEIIGVLGVMAILAGIVSVSVMNSVKLRRRDAEATSMTTIASTLKLTILRTKYVPAETNWSSVTANFLATPINKIIRTDAGTTRRLLVDPALRMGTNVTSVLPYAQGVAGTIQPSTNARMVLISSLMGELPSLTNNTATFSNIWNAPTDGVPAGTSWNGWASRSKDLKILRMDLRNLFSRVVLENLDSFRSAPYSVESTNTLTSVPPGSRREIWLLNSTVLNFHFNDNSLQGREYLVEDVSYTYENGRWGRFLWNGPNRPNGWFGEMVDRFLAARRPDYDTRRFSTQMWTIEAMYVFLWNFGQWSIDSFSSGAPLPHVPAVELSGQGAGTLRSCSSDLLYH